jgi:hypothetical protein
MTDLINHRSYDHFKSCGTQPPIPPLLYLLSIAGDGRVDLALLEISGGGGWGECFHHHTPTARRSRGVSRRVRGLIFTASLASHMLDVDANLPTSDHASFVTASAHIQPRFFIARPSTRSIVAICGAAGGAVALVVIFALIYVLRVRRNVRRFQRSMDVLGPGTSRSWRYIVMGADLFV